MNDAALIEASVPVFRHYLKRIERIVTKLTRQEEVLLQQSLAVHAFSAAEHFRTALGFVPRTVCPLMGQELPDLETAALDVEGLAEMIGRVDALLQGATLQNFEGAASRSIQHTAGTADLEQDATTFLTVFSLPNFFFHMGMAFAILRHEGVDIGKADFDGQHVYPAHFSF